MVYVDQLFTNFAWTLSLSDIWLVYVIYSLYNGEYFVSFMNLSASMLRLNDCVEQRISIFIHY